MAETKKKKTTSSTAVKGKTGKTGKTAKPRTQGSRKKAETDNSFIRAEVFIIGSFALAVLLLLSNFRLCGVAGEFLRSIQLGTFGVIGYIAPILLFVGTCFYMSNKGNSRAMLKMLAVVVLLITLCGFSQLLMGAQETSSQTLKDFYHMSAENGVGGGWIGGLLAGLLKSIVGTIGAFLILSVSLVICSVCITEKSVVTVVKKGSGKAYQYAKEDMDRRKEIHAEKQEEKRRLREEQKVRGVNLESTKLEEAPVPDFFMEEEFGEEKEVPLEGTGDIAADLYALEEAQAALTRSSADFFTGNIVLPPDELEDDTVPFDATEVYGSVGNDIADTVQSEETAYDLEMGPEDYPEEIFLQNEDTFSIPEEAKRVETANGKIIETDTEMLQKKLESKRAEAVADGTLSIQQQIVEKEKIVKKEYIVPPTSLLKRGKKNSGGFSEQEYKETAIKLQQTLQNFGVGVTVTNISCGPSVTRYELHPEQGVKVSRIVGLTDDIKLNLAAADIRIEAPIPGKAAVGIEVPNKENVMVLLRDLFESEEFKKHPSKLAFAVGKDIGGQTIVADIGKMPHLLIAGATGSGKSVCINTLIMSIIYKASPEDVKMIMVDPKVVELSVYNGIPHLLIPVVTDPKKASGALNWAVAEMTDRYKKFAEYNVRDLKGYNAKIDHIEDIEDDQKPQKLPQIVIIVDELADLMMVAPGEVEDSICRLAQLARAAGIHLVIATQRPSVNVITGLIKANVPSRIAFSVSSGVDSRTIIDMNGAEKLLGKGDMLFYPSGYQKPQRVQGAFVSDSEVSDVVEFLTQQEMTTDYCPDIESKMTAPATAEAASNESDLDAYFIQAGKFIIEKDKASIGMLQRVFKIGFNRAARIMDQLAEAGVVGEEEGTKPRKVLMTMEEFEQIAANEA